MFKQFTEIRDNKGFCIFVVSYFSAISFGFMGILLTLEIPHYRSVPLSMYISDNSTRWICDEISFVFFSFTEMRFSSKYVVL